MTRNKKDVFDFEPVNLDDLIDSVIDKTKDTKFEDIMNFNSSMNREIYLYDIMGGTGANIDNSIRFWNNYDESHGIPVEDREPIKLYIDSGGGSLTDTLTIMDSIKLSKTPVWTICIGCAYSGGFFSFIAGHKRIAYPHASFLFHEGSAQNGGTSGQFENFSSFYRKQLEQLKDHVLECTQISEEEYEKIKRDDIWYDVKEGVEKGFIDEVAKGLI